MSVRVEFRWSEDLLARVDAAASFESRASWVRRAVERALGDTGAHPLSRQPPPSAEQPEMTAEQHEIQGLRNFAESMSKSTVARAEEVTGRVSPPKPIPPRVPFRRDVKPFQRGDK